MASAALGQGVAAYVGPLWRISEADARNLATAFYQALLLRRTSLGEALATARRVVREGRSGEEDWLDEAVAGGAGRPHAGDDAAPRDHATGSVGWAGMALYGDPTPTILQRLSPSDALSGSFQRARAGGAPRRS
jgi:CHAT domain-containing protein